jgi:hypothetical protein
MPRPLVHHGSNTLGTLTATMGLNHTSSSPAERHNPQCTNRSEWRLPPGKHPERLSPYYQLACDFGSSLMVAWGTEEGTEPIYLCEAHAKQFLSSAACPGVKSVGQYEERQKGVEAGPVAGPPKPSPASPATKNATPDSRRKPTRPAQSLADRRAAIDRQMSELALQIENILSQSEATIDVASTIDAPLEELILEIIDNPAMSETQKDAAIARLGELQKSLKQGAGQGMTLLEAHRIKQSLAGCLSVEIGVPEEAKAAYRAVHDRMEKAIHAALSRGANSSVSAWDTENASPLEIGSTKGL